MRTIIVVFAALFVVVLSGPAPERRSSPEEDDDPANMKYFLVEREDGTYVIEDLVNAELDPRASASDVTYHFYSRSNPSGVELKHNNVGALSSAGFSPSKDTLFISHGWNNHHGSPVNTHIRQAALARHDVNVFVVDWAPIANKNYISAKNGVVEVGNYVGAFIRSLVASYGLQLSRVALTGHSLGAHVAGNTGAALGGQVRHIVGLDPAGPLFSYSNTDNRLDPTDAQFVQVIHTNGGLLGLKEPIGDSDYFPNGGGSQPGCGLDLAGTCAHSRAYEYYAESISSSSSLFTSTQCSSYSDFSKGRCPSGAKSILGGFAVDTGARGEFYLDTFNSSPYAKG